MRRVLATLLLAALAAPATAFPDRPITIVLPYAPGSAADAYLRVLGEHWPRDMGRPAGKNLRSRRAGVVTPAAPAGKPAGNGTSSAPAGWPTALGQ